MIIYKIELNGKYYIGQTTWGYKLRLSKHLSDLRKNKHSNPKLQNAWNKYGEKSFDSEILDISETIEELNKKEIFWISFFDTVNKGYNIHNGGLNQKLSIETKNKIGVKSKINWMDKEFREKTIKARMKKIACYNLELKIIKVFDSPLNASIYYNALPSQISLAARNQSYAKGYIWKYLKDKWKFQKYNGRIGKMVWAYRKDGTFIKSYTSLEEASKQIGVRKEAIASVAGGDREHHKGIVYRYERQHDKI